MATMKRSSRRTDDPLRQQQERGRVLRHGRAADSFVAANTRAHATNSLLHSPTLKAKRKADDIDEKAARIKSKRPRLTVDILSGPLSATRRAKEVPKPRQNRSPGVPERSSTVPKPKSLPTRQANTRPASARPAANTSAPLKKHQEKVINGIKHELDRLQPSDNDFRPQGRKLRSQEATRFKSELSAYFPDYDEVIGNEPKEQHILNLDTPILIVDTPAGASPAGGAASVVATSIREPVRDKYPVRTYSDALFSNLYDSQRIDFSFLETQYKGKSLTDPLPDSYFQPSHKKAERLERSIRNSEKGRAQHEKDQIIRLLEGLQGPDWLRTMGVSGITESRKKTFEPARVHFIRGCQAILEKFRLWNEEEKRRKAEKDRARAQEAEATSEESEDQGIAAEEEEEDEDNEEPRGEQDQELSQDAVGEEATADEEEESSGDDGDSDALAPPVTGTRQANGTIIEDDLDELAGDPDGPEYSDVDASIAKQLRDEVLARSKRNKPGALSRATSRASSGGPPTANNIRRNTAAAAAAAQSKLSLRTRQSRTAAMSEPAGRQRRAKHVAWGQPVPEPAESEFQLPKEIRDSPRRTRSGVMARGGGRRRGRGRGGVGRASVRGRGGVRGRARARGRE